jgi:rubrerythrin
MLSGKGFKKVFNVAGGIKAWESKTAVGTPDLGMDLFTDRQEPRDVLILAYSLEQGLRDFYLAMGKKAVDTEVKSLFDKLAEIELEHQASIIEAYNRLNDDSNSKDSKDSMAPMDQDGFEDLVETSALEGGLTTEEYLELFNPDLNSPVEVISLAMSIEAQALDLYQRASLSFVDSKSKEIVQGIANEEKAHIASLGRLMDTL